MPSSSTTTATAAPISTSRTTRTQQLYKNVLWPGGAQADPEGLGFRFEERAAREGVADAYAGMGIAAEPGTQGRLALFVSNSRNEPSAAFRRDAGAGSPAFANARPAVDPALGSAFAGWGASWVDLVELRRPRPRARGRRDPGHEPEAGRRAAAPAHAVGGQHGQARYGDARKVFGVGGLRLNGRGLAAADAGTTGAWTSRSTRSVGSSTLLRPTGVSGHWLDVELSRFSPGAVVTATLPDGRRLTHIVQAGSSYLSSEDPRIHFGLGAATSVRSLTVRYPWGGTSSVGDVAANRVVRITSPPPVKVVAKPVATPTPANCRPASRQGRSVARIWNDQAVDALRVGGASEPVQARDLFDLSTAISQAWHATGGQQARETAISYAAYRLLVWRASFNANLERTFSMLTERMRSLCYTPNFTSTAGDSPAALGNRIAAAAIAAGRHDGSNEELRYADPSYTPVNEPLAVGTPGSAVHDPTFWQPLALSQKAAQGGGSVSADVQTFENSQWGRVRTFAKRVDAGSPGLGDPSSAAYKQAAVEAIRATSQPAGRTMVDASPLGWNRVAASLPAGTSADARLAHDVRLDLALNAALNDAAVSAWGAKRANQAPRPISMIRYLAFNNQLPLVHGLVRRVGDQQLVLRAGRWVPGAGWSALAPTPPSPGWPSGDAAFAYAANEVLTSISGRSFAGPAARAATQGVERGTELAGDATAGRILGTKVGKLVLRDLAR